MNKKLVYILSVLIILVLCNYKVKASEEIIDNSKNPLFAEVGTLNANYMLTKDVKSISTNVNFQNEGNYKATYYNEDNQSYIRDIIIKNKNNIENGIDYNKYIGGCSLKLNDNYIVNDYNVCIITDLSYYIYINYHINNISYSQIVYYKNGILESSITLNNIKIIDYIINNTNLIYLFESYTSVYTKIGIGMLDIKLEMKNYYLFSSNKIEEGIDISLINNYLYIIAHTTSNTIIHEREKSNKVCLLLKCDLITFNSVSSFIIGNNYDNNVKKVECIGDNIYIDINLNGSSGEYYNTLDNSYSSRMMIIIDQDLKVLSKTSISKSYKDYKGFYCKEYYFLIMEEKEYKRFIVLYSDYDNENEIYIVNSQLEKNITSVKYVLLNNILYLFINTDCFEEIIKINKTEYNKQLFNHKQKCEKLFSSNNHIYYVLENDNILLYKYAYITIKKEIRENDNKIQYTYANTYYNNLLLESKMRTTLNDSDFGEYNTPIYLYNNEYTIVYNSKINYPLKINITENSVYDIGFILEFNGKGILNNNEIYNGYVINEIGKYCLIINGANNIKKIINFEIKDLCEKTIYYTRNTMSIPKSNIIMFDNDNINDSQNINIIDNEKDNYIDTNYIIPIMSIIMIIGLIILYCIFKRKKKA